ncbi:MAG: formate dehydrogenase accessory sulfurtransferase FdhD [Euryarchaeota archaeon]|nr:formate dehydrogenase accessory sulfurtransferase FdhD [Euryarchaeota archaeon]
MHAKTIPLLEEEAVSIRLNGSYLLTAMISPRNKEEFVTGYLFTEELISSLADIESFRIENNTVSVLTKNPFKMSKRRMVISGCGGSSSFLDDKKLKRIETSSYIHKSTVHKSIARLPCTPSAALWNNDTCIFQCTDIGVHSACVTCIGYGLMHAIDFSACIFAISGRIATDIVRISLICGIPVVASSSITTRLAVGIAQHLGLCIICGVDNDDMIIYTNENRIINS